MQPKLVAIAGPWKGLSYPLADGTHIVGRESESDIQLDEAAVSRRHCVIERCGDRCTVRDLKSRNGTFVNADRKSTRLNSSHSQISYAVFCLKKKRTSMLSTDDC